MMVVSPHHPAKPSPLSVRRLRRTVTQVQHSLREGWSRSTWKRHFFLGPLPCIRPVLRSWTACPPHEACFGRRAAGGRIPRLISFPKNRPRLQTSSTVSAKRDHPRAAPLCPCLPGSSARVCSPKGREEFRGREPSVQGVRTCRLRLCHTGRQSIRTTGKCASLCPDRRKRHQSGHARGPCIASRSRPVKEQHYSPIRSP